MNNTGGFRGLVNQHFETTHSNHLHLILLIHSKIGNQDVGSNLGVRVFTASEEENCFPSKHICNELMRFYSFGKKDWCRWWRKKEEKKVWEEK